MAKGVCGGECAWQGAYVMGGMHGRCMRGRRACVVGACLVGVCMQDRQLLKWAVRILLECILVSNSVNPVFSTMDLTIF